MNSKKNLNYKVILAKEASTYISRLNREVQARLIKRLEALSIDPFSGDVKKLKGKSNRWRCIG